MELYQLWRWCHNYEASRWGIVRRPQDSAAISLQIRTKFLRIRDVIIITDLCVDEQVKLMVN